MIYIFFRVHYNIDMGTSDVIREKLKSLPSSSGVYIMLDEFGGILYVGKAKNLKNRVRQYFQNSATKTEKTILLVEKIKDFRYIVTANEVEALVLENNLIKKHKPYYNILLKDDKSYPYIKINLKEDFPRVEVVRRLRADGSRYFGPYMIGLTASATMDLIHSVFPIRSCSGSLAPRKGKRECLNYHIGRCLAPCTGRCTKEEYNAVIKKVMAFLSGQDKEARDILEAKLKDAVAREEFERAIVYRENLALMDKIVRKQNINLPRDFNLDIFAYATNGMYGVVNYTVVRGGKVTGSENMPVSDPGEPQDIMSSFIMQFYDKNPVVADEILVNTPVSFDTELNDYISAKKGSKTHLFEPKGGARGQLMQLAYNNAAEYLEKSSARIASHEALTKGAVEQLKEMLDLSVLPYRMECYDISNISGTDKVASMVVFVNGEARHELYRRFRIKSFVGADDFRSMREVLSRRVAELKKGTDVSFSARPDLIIVDGGKGQLSSAQEILADTGIELAGLAKREEEIFRPHESDPKILPRDSLALKLCQRIRDEAHRFAITYHRKLRNERMTRSNLKNIEGVGDKRARALLAYFKKVENIASAPVEEIEKVDGFGRDSAEKVYKYFHREDNDA